QVAGHEVHVIGEVLPRARHSGHLRLPAELAVRTDFARHAGDFSGERVQLIHHRVNCVLQLENFALHVHRDLAREVSARNGRGHFRDVSNLAREVTGHGVHGVGEILPCAGDSGHVGLAAEPALGTYFAGDAGDLACECVELVDHRVDCFLQEQNLAADVHGDFLGEVAAGDGRGDFRDVTDLAGEVAGHRVDGVREVFPRAGNVRHLRLAAEFAVGTDFARHASDFGCECAQLINHGVDGVFELENFAFYVDRDFAGKIAAGNSRSDFGDVTDLAGEVAGHEVHVVGEVFPRAGTGHLRLTAEFAFGADFARHAGDFSGERVQLVHHGVNCVLQLENFALHVHRDLAREVSARNGRGHFRNVADLSGQVSGHRVYGVGQVFPGSRHAGHVGLAAQPAFGADFARHARDFSGEPVQLVHHGVESFFELEDFAADVNGDFARKVAAGDRRGDFGDVTDLACQVGGHAVHAVGEVFP